MNANPTRTTRRFKLRLVSGGEANLPSQAVAYERIRLDSFVRNCEKVEYRSDDDGDDARVGSDASMSSGRRRRGGMNGDVIIRFLINVRSGAVAAARLKNGLYTSYRALNMWYSSVLIPNLLERRLQ